MADDITVKIGAKDNASPTLDKIQKKADKLDKEKVELTVDAKVGKALDALDKVADQAKRTQTAADALGKALGPELAGRMDLTKAVRDFQRMDLTLEDITVNADKLGGKLKEIDDQNLGGKLAGGASKAKDDIDAVGKSAGSSSSALANMVGNSAQDLGTLGGVAGSTGVAIGQMAEYMADAALEGESMIGVLKNFAAVAGPIAAIGAGIALLSSTFADISREAEESKKNVEEFRTAITGAGDDTLAIADRLRQGTDDMDKFLGHATSTMGLVGEFFQREVIGKIPLLGSLFKEEGINVQETLKKVGTNLFEVAKTTEGNVIQNAKFEQSLLDAKDAGKITGDEYQKLTQWLHGYQLEVHKAKEVQEAFNVSGLEEANAILKDVTEQRAPLKAYTDDWNTLMKDLADGKVDTQAAADALNRLNTELGIPPSEAIGKALDAIDAEKAKEAAKAIAALQAGVQQATDDWKAQQDATAQAAKAVTDYVTAVNSADWKNAGLTGATAAMKDFSEAQFGAADAILDVETAIDDLGKTWKDTGVDIKKTKFGQDFATENGRKNQQAIEQLARAVDEQLGPAFADAGGDFNKFKENAERITQQALGPLRDEFQLSKTQVEELRKQLGLTTGDFEARFKLSGVEEAKVKLGLLNSAISGLDRPTQMKIGAQIAEGDVQGAVKTAQDAFNDPNNQVNIDAGIQPPSEEQIAATVVAVMDYYAHHPMPVIPVDLDTTPALKRIKALQDFIHTQFPKFTAADFPQGLDVGGTAGGMGGIAGERGPEIINSRYLTTGPTYVPPGTRVTSRKRTATILRTHGTRGLKRYDAGGIVPRSTSVTINTAVIGSTFDVMNAVHDAVRRAQRLLPRNP